MQDKKYDKYILDIFITNKQKINGNQIRKIEKYNNIKNYLLNRYEDENDYRVIIWRIFYKIEFRPVCGICGKKTKFDFKHKCYKKYCCSKCAAKSEERNKKYKETCLDKYGHINPLHNSIIKNKYKQKWESKYGVDNPMKSNIIKEKIKKTNLERYGVEYTFQTKNNINKSKNTKLKKYGNENFINIEKRNKTCLEKYGNECIFASSYFKNKSKETLIKKYGVDNILKLPDVANKISNSEDRKQKEYETKKRNNSFNKSRPEDESYLLLKEKFPDVIRQYKSDKYPYYCDFYIPSKDIYIECNYSWTHGGKPYEGTDSDIQIVNTWKLKNTKYYNNAIITWTVRDVKKRNIAKENKLNYYEFFSMLNLNIWLRNNYEL